MRRGAVIAGWGLGLLLLSALPGCSWFGVRRRIDDRPGTGARAARAQQISEQIQDAIDRGEYASARNALIQFLQQSPDSVEARQRLGTVLRLEGRLPDAEACFRDALKRDHDYVDALIGLGQVEAERGDLASALKRFETAIEIDPHLFKAHYSLGRLLEAAGKTDDALAAYFRALEFEPNHPESSLRVAAIQLARNQPDQVLSRLDPVVELAPENGEARALRGRAQLALRHFSQAVADFRAAADRLPTRPEVYYQLALALEADHRPAEALRAAERALRLAPDFGDARALSRRLALAVAPAGKNRLAPGASAGARSDTQVPTTPLR
jgi:tetratricopeptide (TPR) repeat protein